jgi:flagellar biosynthesis protein FlhB
MSEHDDPESRTEEPSEKKRNEASAKGDVPHSREASIAASALGVAIALTVLRRADNSSIVSLPAAAIDHAGDLRLISGADAARLAWSIGRAMAGALAFPVGALLVVAAVGALGQSAPKLIAKRIAPDPSRISPAAGMKRLFSGRALVDVARSITRLAAVSLTAFTILWAARFELVEAVAFDTIHLADFILALALKVAWFVFATLFLFAAIDVVIARVRWSRKLRMTRQELKEELKESEGDPLVKARRRSIAMRRARQRMLANVPRATLVIANPTHYAVALRYVSGESGAPIVLAKGTEHLALKIRESAEARGIPVVENPSLARAMYDAVKLEQLIPPEFYRAVAEIINFLQSRKPRVV